MPVRLNPGWKEFLPNTIRVVGGLGGQLVGRRPLAASTPKPSLPRRPTSLIPFGSMAAGRGYTVATGRR